MMIINLDKLHLILGHSVLVKVEIFCGKTFVVLKNIKSPTELIRITPEQWNKLKNIRNNRMSVHKISKRISEYTLSFDRNFQVLCTFLFPESNSRFPQLAISRSKFTETGSICQGSVVISYKCFLKLLEAADEVDAFIRIARRLEPAVDFMFRVLAASFYQKIDKEAYRSWTGAHLSGIDSVVFRKEVLIAKAATSESEIKELFMRRLTEMPPSLHEINDVFDDIYSYCNGRTVNLLRFYLKPGELNNFSCFYRHEVQIKPPKNELFCSPFPRIKTEKLTEAII